LTKSWNKFCSNIGKETQPSLTSNETTNIDEILSSLLTKSLNPINSLFENSLPILDQIGDFHRGENITNENILTLFPVEEEIRKSYESVNSKIPFDVNFPPVLNTRSRQKDNEITEIKKAQTLKMSPISSTKAEATKESFNHLTLSSSQPHLVGKAKISESSVSIKDKIEEVSDRVEDNTSGTTPVLPNNTTSTTIASTNSIKITSNAISANILTTLVSNPSFITPPAAKNVNISKHTTIDSFTFSATESKSRRGEILITVSTSSLKSITTISTDTETNAKSQKEELSPAYFLKRCFQDSSDPSCTFSKNIPMEKIRKTTTTTSTTTRLDPHSEAIKAKVQAELREAFRGS
jgi:hypothetical protein